MAVANIVGMPVFKASKQCAENILESRKEFVASLTEYQREIFRTQLENAFEIGWFSGIGE